MIVKGNVRRLLRSMNLVLAGLALAALFGCSASTVVPLRYQPSTPQGSLACTQSFTLLPFVDKRADTLTIGALSDGKRFYAENDPGEWVSWAMFEELKARGCEVKYHERTGGAAPKGYVVSGSFDTLNVDSGTTLMAKANLRVRVRLEKDGAQVIDAIGAVWAPSWRLVVEMGPEVRAWGNYPGGQSGNPGSSAYADRVVDWAAGRPYELVFLKSADEPHPRVAGRTVLRGKR